MPNLRTHEKIADNAMFSTWRHRTTRETFRIRKRVSADCPLTPFEREHLADSGNFISTARVMMRERPHMNLMECYDLLKKVCGI